MKNPYALYYIGEDDNDNPQVKKALNVQRAITSALSSLVNLAKDNLLTSFIAEDTGKKILKIKNLREVGALDTSSRESIFLNLKDRLEKEANLDKKTAEKLSDALYQVL